MAEDIKVNDQVMVKRQMRNGRLVRFGSVVSISGQSARVNFPIDHTSVVVPLDQLEKTSTKFGGYARVQPNQIQRSFTSLTNR